MAVWGDALRGRGAHSLERPAPRSGSPVHSVGGAQRNVPGPGADLAEDRDERPADIAEAHVPGGSIDDQPRSPVVATVMLTSRTNCGGKTSAAEPLSNEQLVMGHRVS